MPWAVSTKNQHPIHAATVTEMDIFASLVNIFLFAKISRSYSGNCFMPVVQLWEWGMKIKALFEK